jgi:hypothetical protein
MLFGFDRVLLVNYEFLGGFLEFEFLQRFVGVFGNGDFWVKFKCILSLKYGNFKW